MAGSRELEELRSGYEKLCKVLYEEKLAESQIEAKELLTDSAVYFRLNGRYVKTPAAEEKTSEMQRVMYSLHSMQVSFALVMYFNGKEISVYLGVEREHAEKTLEVFRSVYGISCGKEGMSSEKRYRGYEVFQDSSMRLCGLLKGNLDTNQNLSESVIDTLLSGEFRNRFAVVIVAEPEEKKVSRTLTDTWADICAKCEMVKSKQLSENYDGITTISMEHRESKIIEYLALAEKFHALAAQGAACGTWDTSVKLYAESMDHAEAVAGIIAAACSNPETLPEPIRMIKVYSGSGRYFDYNAQVYSYINHQLELRYLQEGIYGGLSNFYTSDELASIAGLPSRDMFGFFVRDRVDFDVSREEKQGISLGNILRNGQVTQEEYWFDPDQLIRHGVIAGLTGSGKTNSVKSLLRNLQNYPKKIPTLVIESAKSEYWEMYNLGCTDMKIYTVDNMTNRLFLNPFECETVNGKRASVQTHIEHVFAAFKASFIMYTPQPYVLERAIYAVYEDCGWDIANDRNKYGEAYPTIEHLYRKIPCIVEEMGYSDRMKDDLISSLQARINSLRVGQKGNILNVKKSCRINELFEGNTVIELDGIGDDEAKAFIISMILIKLKEYRSRQEDSQKEIRHFLLIEEAHRLLKNVSSGTGESADPRGNAVEFFCNLLAELRSKGQAFLIADQIPSKLAPDVVDNTNLKIVHRLVTEKERELMGRSMHMTEEQIDYLSTLPQGVAAVYSEGDYRPKLVKAAYAGKYKNSELTHEEIYERCANRTYMQNTSNEMAKAPGTCGACPFSYLCDFRLVNTIPQEVKKIIRESCDDGAIQKGLPEIGEVLSKVDLFITKYIKSGNQYSDSLLRENMCLVKLILENGYKVPWEKYINDCVKLVRMHGYI